MKRILVVLALMLGTQIINAQDFKKVSASLLIQQYDAAKSEYEKVIAKKPAIASTAEGFYWKAKIYSGLNKDAAKNPTAYDQVKSAIDEYIKLEKDNGFPIAKENGTEPFFDVYLKSFKDGVNAFNSKSWKDAASSFSNAVTFSDIIFSNGWSSSKQKFDTTSLVYAGYSNQNAGNIEATITYYSRLIDYKVSAPEYIDVYRYVLVQYITKKEKSKFDATLEAAIAAYPKETWNDYATDYIDKNLSIDEKVALYEQKLAAGSLKELDFQMYGDMFMSGKTDQNPDKYIQKAAEAYKKAYELNNKNYAAAFNIGIAYYNQFTLLDEKVGQNIKALQNLNANKPVAPKDPKKKLAFDAAFKVQVDSIKKLNVVLEAPIKEKVDASIEWITKAYDVIKDKEKLERAEKNVAIRSVDFLATLYAYKRDKARGKDLKASDEYDLKFNIYDKLHDKYQ
jgi:tetratricopeptide (TPR) repeat protein